MSFLGFKSSIRQSASLDFRSVYSLLWVVCSFFVGTKVSVAQDDVSAITWADVTYFYYTSEKFGIGGDGGLRGLVSKPDWAMVYIRPAVVHRLSPFVELKGSVGFFETFQKTPANMFELRLCQEVKAQWPTLQRMYFRHRLRVEERFLFYADAEGSQDMDRQQQNYRARYYLGAKSNYFKVAEKAKYLYVHGGVEYFIPFNHSADERFSNAARVSAGFGQELKLGFNYELDFIWQASRNTLEGDFKTDEFILRFKLIFNHYKKVEPQKE